MKDMFTTDERTRIREAVAAAEQYTSGEIVPYIVARSDRYEAAVWRGALLLALVGLLLVFSIMYLYQGWGLAWIYTGWGTGLVVVALGAIGALLARYVPALTRFLAGAGEMRQRVHDRALRAFVEEEIFDTRDRTGILLFVSLLERRIEVLGDAGINRKVKIEEWIDVVERIRTGIREGRLAEGLVAAIGLCGDLLQRRGVEIRPDDEDELSNEVRIREE